MNQYGICLESLKKFIKPNDFMNHLMETYTPSLTTLSILKNTDNVLSFIEDIITTHDPKTNRLIVKYDLNVLEYSVLMSELSVFMHDDHKDKYITMLYDKYTDENELTDGDELRICKFYISQLHNMSGNVLRETCNNFSIPYLKSFIFAEKTSNNIKTIINKMRYSSKSTLSYSDVCCVYMLYLATNIPIREICNAYKINTNTLYYMTNSMNIGTRI